MSQDHASSYTATYNSRDHVAVLTQMWGSKWPEVLPYCICNVILMLTLIILNRLFHVSIVTTTQPHTFVSVVVAFLLVSRVTTAVGRYTDTRVCLSTMYQDARTLVQDACAFTWNEQGDMARQWRHDLAYRSLLLLRTCMAVTNYPTKKIPAWEIPELNGVEQEDVYHVICDPNSRRWTHSRRTESEESMRVPIRVAYLLRKTIIEHEIRLSKALQVNREVKLLGTLDGFMNGYFGMRRFMTTPVPFPLIQMNRTLLFLYVFTVPFVLVSDPSFLIAKCLAVFILTFGYVGLELVAIELDNPFGDDPNDFDNEAMAEVAYEDIYITISDVDGAPWADKLRLRMDDKSGSIIYDEQSWLLGSNNGIGNG